MKNFIIIFSLAIILQPVHLIAEPLIKSYISTDANWVVHIDYDRFRKSQVGQVIRSEIVNSGIEAEFNKFKETFSFHPIDDINSITIYGQGKNHENAVALIKGRFDKDKLLGFVRKNPGYKQIEYNGMVIHQLNQPVNDFPQSTTEGMMYGGFYDKNLIILNRKLAEIEKALEVLQGLRPGADNDIFGDNIISNGTFFEAFVKNVSEFIDGDSNAVILRNTRQLVLEVGENNDKVFIKITLYADSRETIEGIKKLLDGIIAYLILEKSETTELTELAKRIHLTVDDKKLQIILETEPVTLKPLIQQRFPW